MHTRQKSDTGSTSTLRNTITYLVRVIQRLIPFIALTLQPKTYLWFNMRIHSIRACKLSYRAFRFTFYELLNKRIEKDDEYSKYSSFTISFITWIWTCRIQKKRMNWNERRTLCAWLWSFCFKIVWKIVCHVCMRYAVLQEKKPMSYDKILYELQAHMYTSNSRHVLNYYFAFIVHKVCIFSKYKLNKGEFYFPIK